MKLLREMIETAKRKKFEIRNVVPDGNCMFAAVVDQLELTGCHGMFSAISLRQEAVNYLRAHPESEDGTHYTMFMDGEEWEEYLTRMSREGQWGDHLILKALSKVTERDIKVLSGNENRGFTDIKCGTDQSDIEPLVLGHVGELHYVSLRPASAEEYLEKKQMFMEDYVDPYSDTPALHLGYLIKKFLPPSSILSEADRYVSTALSLEYMDDTTNGEGQAQGASLFTLKTIGDITNGLYAGKIESEASESGGATLWTDVVVLQVLNDVTTLESGIEPQSEDEVSLETRFVHPGYTRLRCVYPVSKDGRSNRLETLYFPNAYEKFQALKLSEEEKRQRASQYGSQIVSLFSDYKAAIRCLFWPKEAKEWTERVRPTGWPSETLIQSIISNGCHLVAEPHHNSSRPDVEFRISFGAAENSLCEEGLSRDQRYGYIAFKAFCYQELKDVPFINSLHLRSIFFYACERVQAECWSSKLGGCIFYLIDYLIGSVTEGCIPCYFIRENNLISHLTETERQTVLQRLENLRSQPLQHFMSFKMAMDDTEAVHVLENVREDMENNFLVHYSVRKSVLECFVPMSIDMAKRNIEKKVFKNALDEVQAAYEERLTVATCEDNLPFVDFLNEVVSTVEYRLQWWFLLFADEKLGTTLSCDLSMSNEPIAIEDLVGDEVAKEYKSTLIPSRLASYQCTFLYDFALYLFMKYRTTQAVSCLQLCIDRHNQLLIYIHQRSANEEDTKNMIGDFTDRNMLKIFVFLYLCCSRLRKYDVISQYIPAMEDLCARLGTREPYCQLLLLYQTLGYEEDYERILSTCNQLPSGHNDVIKLVSQDVMSQTTTF
ncbi:hypothetical protein FSP39_002017 [Pinctada imbricata]|uniref:OTU domain-containing protein n=1 Tax=Pinctada imbricata TaxID=66713 RepID=A0AA89C8K6_PINIB|nr:hypothetical protein FSP39_002017 [Pinctada imbricata]